MLLWIYHSVAWWSNGMAGVSVLGNCVCRNECGVLGLMQGRRVEDMLCYGRSRMLEHQLLYGRGAGQRASGVLGSSQPKGLATRGKRSMLC